MDEFLIDQSRSRNYVWFSPLANQFLTVYLVSDCMELIISSKMNHTQPLMLVLFEFQDREGNLIMFLNQS